MCYSQCGRNRDVPLQSPFQKGLAAQLWGVWFVQGPQLLLLQGLLQLSSRGHTICGVALGQWVSQTVVAKNMFLSQQPPVNDWTKHKYKGPATQRGIPSMGKLCSWAPAGQAEARPGGHGRLTAPPARSCSLSFPFTGLLPSKYLALLTAWHLLPEKPNCDT